MRIRRDHNLGIDAAKKRVDEVALDLQQRFSLRSEWRGDRLHFKGSGINGDVAVSDNSIEFNVKLGFALMMMEEPIRSAISSALDDHLA